MAHTESIVKLMNILMIVLKVVPLSTLSHNTLFTFTVPSGNFFLFIIDFPNSIHYTAQDPTLHYFTSLSNTSSQQLYNIAKNCFPSAKCIVKKNYRSPKTASPVSRLQQVIHIGEVNSGIR